MILAAALTLTLQLERTSFDLLDGVSIEVVAHNTGSKPIPVVFPKPAEYEISITKDGQEVWSSHSADPVGATIPAHMHALMPGPNVLTVYIWNAIENDGSTPGPGEYVVHAKLMGESIHPEASLPIRFINPVPISALAKLKVGDEITIAGTLDASKQILTDATGSIPLMKRVPLTGIVAVRGFITERPDHTRALYVKRWAKMQ